MTVVIEVYCLSWLNVLNFLLPARLGLLASRRLTQKSLWSVYSLWCNVGRVTKSLSALLTLCQDKSESDQMANHLARSTSPALGNPDETFQPNRARPIRLLSHLSAPLAPRPPLSNLGSRIAFQSPTKTNRFGSSRNDPNR